MEEDFNAIVFDVTKAAAGTLDLLDAAVQTFGNSIGYPVRDVIAQSFGVALERPRHSLDRLA